MMNRIAILFLLPLLCSALYQDQVGKFDWRKSHLGCPHQTWFDKLRSQNVLVVVSKENVIGRIDVESGDIIWRQLNEGSASGQMEILSIDHSTILVQLGQNKRAFDLHTGAFQWQRKLPTNSSSIADKQQQKNQVAEAELQKATIDLLSGQVQILVDLKAPIKLDLSGTPIQEVKVLTAEGDRGGYKIFVTRADCRLDLYEYSLVNEASSSSQMPKLLWSRHESLGSISDAFMVDLPLSESQAQIESEFNQKESIMLSFVLRIRSQLEQLNRFFMKTAERAMQTADLVVRGQLDYSMLLKQLFDIGGRMRGGEDPLERDYFNMRKMIVVSTSAGTLHGLSNDNGRVHWSLYLGDKFQPYKVAKVPLFLLRGTSFYQWESQAAAVFDIKNSQDSIILVFSPITGRQIDRIEISGGLLRVELWPFATAEQLHPILLLRNRRPNIAELWPPVQTAQAKPTFLMMDQKKTGMLTGYEVPTADVGGQLRERWRTLLSGFGTESKDGNEIIEVIRGKSPLEKVHSQGRVLGDRSVLYKYANPNLVAILSHNRPESSLRLHLVDAVSGELVYTGKYSKAHPPFHIVHCENWIVISYWNEKARRTEIGVVELFEGEGLTNSTAFDSLHPTREPVKVLAQTYIFPQGISCMATTETEQGLTSRSLLIAVPFGGVLEMSRRLLDARRPLEMTPELREEMIVPYIPELPLATEEFINYNQTVMNVRGIRTAPSGLESTSLVFVYGLDLFYTRVMPSGTFDILKDDFDYVLIALVMVLLTVASYVCKRISRYQSIQKAWE